MKKQQTGKRKQYRIWIWLLVKRLWRQPAYVGLLALIPLLGYAVSMMEQGERGGAVVSVCVENSAWSGQIVEELNRQAKESVLRFAFYNDSLEVEQSVAKAEADCGFVIAADIQDRVMEEDWRKTITVYETSASSITGMAKERISGVIFKLYSERRYEDYMRETARAMQDGSSGETAEMSRTMQDGLSDETAEMSRMMQDGLSDEMDEMPRTMQDGSSDEMAEIPPDISEQVVDFAKEAYEWHLVDNSTFSFRYENTDQYGQQTVGADATYDASVFPIKGVFAVVIFISGMCGMLEYDRDRREKRFARMAPNALTYIVDIWVPTVFVSVAVLICLWLADGIRYCGGAALTGNEVSAGMSIKEILTVWSAGAWLGQIGRMIVYQCVIVVYCGMLGIVLRGQEAVAAAIPILSLGSLVCSPVFVRLAAYLPIFAVLEKLFPATYYLML